MGDKMRFFVAAGALLGAVGVFLPLASVSAARPAGGGMLELGLSLWSGSALVGAGFLAYAVLGLYALALMFGVIGIAKGFGRGLASGALLAALAPAAVSAYWMTDAISLGATGVGLVLLTLGGVTVSAASLATIVRPRPALVRAAA
jgi:hypothetical protein